jgi:ribosomal protein S18 acetylase RimI-like enzyme
MQHMPAVNVAEAGTGDQAELAAVAAATFPLACPPSTAAQDISGFITAQLSEKRFAEYLRDPDRIVLTAVAAGRIVGYAMLIHGVGDDPDISGSVPQRPAVELSKMYVQPDFHRTGTAAALIRSGIGWAADGGARAVWLGVNQNNERAQRFYRKHRFEVTGTRSFRLGAALEDDFVMVRPL